MHPADDEIFSPAQLESWREKRHAEFCLGGGGTSAIHGVVTFSNWGENKSQSAPAGAFSLLKLVPASSSSSTAG